jgi:hypothetical protein
VLCGRPGVQVLLLRRSGAALTTGDLSSEQAMAKAIARITATMMRATIASHRHNC